MARWENGVCVCVCDWRCHRVYDLLKAPPHTQIIICILPANHLYTRIYIKYNVNKILILFYILTNLNIINDWLFLAGNTSNSAHHLSYGHLINFKPPVLSDAVFLLSFHFAHYHHHHLLSSSRAAVGVCVCADGSARCITAAYSFLTRSRATKVFLLVTHGDEDGIAGKARQREAKKRKRKKGKKSKNNTKKKKSLFMASNHKLWHFHRLYAIKREREFFYFIFLAFFFAVFRMFGE